METWAPVVFCEERPVLTRLGAGETQCRILLTPDSYISQQILNLSLHLSLEMNLTFPRDGWTPTSDEPSDHNLVVDTSLSVKV